MFSTFKAIDYFKYGLHEPLFEVEEILNDISHVEHKHLTYDYENIDKHELNHFVEAKRIDRFLGRWSDKDKGRRTLYLVDKLQEEIARHRLIALADTSNGGTEFPSNNLSDIEIFKNNLVSVLNFTPDIAGFRFKEYVYQLAPSIREANSSYWLTQEIIRLMREKGLNFKIRLDPFIEKHFSEYHPIVNYMTIYGRLLDWDRLKNLEEDDPGRWKEESSSPKTTSTDYVWHPNDDEIHFTCEELPKLEEIEFRASRYFHAIIKKDTGLISHCDGAIRIYTEHELIKRIESHVKNSDVRKIGKRVKLFQLDEMIDQDTFSRLLVNFMVWNDDVLEYFNPGYFRIG